jgi:hypothetical protein
MVGLPGFSSIKLLSAKGNLALDLIFQPILVNGLNSISKSVTSESELLLDDDSTLGDVLWAEFFSPLGCVNKVLAQVISFLSKVKIWEYSEKFTLAQSAASGASFIYFWSWATGCSPMMLKVNSLRYSHSASLLRGDHKSSPLGVFFSGKSNK